MTRKSDQDFEHWDVEGWRSEDLERLDLGPLGVQLVNDRAVYVFLWWPVFLVIQFVAFCIVFALEPAGFDSCEAIPSATARTIQVVIASVAVGGSGALALWRLRGSLRLAALIPTAMSIAVWWWLLTPAGSCAPS